MEISDDLLCLFSAEIEEQADGAVVDIPDHEIEHGGLDPGVSYRIAILEAPTRSQQSSPPDTQSEPSSTPGGDRQTPPVEEGDTVDVEIESIGDQGDGIARVDRGYVLIVPDTEVAERVTVEVTDVTPTVAFCDVVDRHDPIID